MSATDLHVGGTPAGLSPSGLALAWDGPTRLFKWTLVALVLDGWISNTFGGAIPTWHKWNGYALLVLVVFRLLWGMVGGSTARFAAFVAGPKRAFDYGLSLVRGQPRRYLGHNPLGGWMVLALLALVGLQAVSGLYAADEDRLIIEGPLAKTVADATVDFAARWHHRLFNVIELLAVAHISANLFYTFVKRDPLVQAMIGGSKPAEAFVDQPSARPGSWTLAAACMALAAAIVFGAITAAGGKIF
jgi:cytochrome b